MKRSLMVLFLLLSAAMAACPAANRPTATGITVLPTGGRNIWRLAAAHLTADRSSTQIVGTTYDGRLCAFDLQGHQLTLLWDAPVGAFSFAITAAPTGPGQPDQVVVGTATGKVIAFNASGKRVWSADFGTPVYAVAAARTPTGTWIVAGTVDGTIAVFDLKGNLKKKIVLNGAIRTLVAGDYLGNGQQEVFVGFFTRDDTDFGQVMRLPDLTGVWTDFKPLGMSGNEHGMNAVAADILDNGKDQLVSQADVVAPSDGYTALYIMRKPGVKQYYAGDYRMAIPTAGRFVTGSGTADVALVYGEELGLYEAKQPGTNGHAVYASNVSQDDGADDDEDTPHVPKANKKQKNIDAGDSSDQNVQQQGEPAKPKKGNNKSTEGKQPKVKSHIENVIGPKTIELTPLLSAESKISFTDILTIHGKDGDQLLLGSAPNGDDNLYLVTPDANNTWVKTLTNLQWSGHIAQVNENVESLGKQIKAWHGTPAVGQDGPYVVVPEFRPKFGLNVSIDAAAQLMESTNKYYRQRFPYPDRIKFTQEFEIQEKGEEGNGKGLSNDQCVEVARKLEAAHVPWIARIGHGGGVYVTERTLEAMVEAAPTTAVGFSTAEQGPGKMLVPTLDKLIPLMEVAKRHHLYFYFNEKNTFWASVASQPEVMDFFFNPHFYGTVVPSAEDSNSRSPDLSMFSRLGLFAAGRSSSWGSRLVADAFSFNRLWDWERVMVGNPHLRSLLAQSELGAKHFVLNSIQRSETGVPNLVLNAGEAQFLDMLGKGIIAPPTVAQMGNLSPVALEIKDPSRRFIGSGTGGHDYRSGIAESDYVFGKLQNYWGMSPTGPNDIARVAWGRQRQFGSYIPDIGADGDGLLLPIPGGLTVRSPSRWSKTFVTDGDSITGFGSEPAGVAAVKNAMDIGAASLPVRVQGKVFYQCSKQSDSLYQIVMADSGYLDPQDREVTLKSQLPGEWKLRDRITGEDLGPLGEGQTTEIIVLAGTLRVLELVK